MLDAKLEYGAQSFGHNPFAPINLGQIKRKTGFVIVPIHGIKTASSDDFILIVFGDAPNQSPACDKKTIILICNSLFDCRHTCKWADVVKFNHFRVRNKAQTNLARLQA